MGRSGLRVSAVGLGCNNFGMWIDRETSLAVVHKALDVGITTFDTADAYGDGASETLLGEGLGTRRKDTVIITKGGGGRTPDARNVSRRHLIAACEASLTRLGTDWIDLYMIHSPDGRTPVDETLRAMEDLIRQGKIRYAGACNMVAWQIADAAWTAKAANLNGFIGGQDEYSLLARGAEVEKLPAMDHFGWGFTPYFPLASGMLTGKYTSRSAIPADARFSKVAPLGDRYLTDINLERVRGLAEFASANGRSLVELAFSWLAASPVVSSIIAGATSPQQVESNAAATTWTLTPEDMAAVANLTS